MFAADENLTGPQSDWLSTFFDVGGIIGECFHRPFQVQTCPCRHGDNVGICVLEETGYSSKVFPS